MNSIIELNIRAGISIISIITSWFIAQASVVEQGFDQLFSLGLLMVAVTVIWKAFSRKDESETQLLQEKAEMYRELAEARQEIIESMKND